MMCSELKQAIIINLKRNLTRISDEFDPPLNTSQVVQACDIGNWDKAIDNCGRRKNGNYVYGFNCDPLDSQLRAYVEVNKHDQIIYVTVQGE